MIKDLLALGLSPFFTGQLGSDEIESDRIARISEVQRNGVTVTNGEINTDIVLGSTWFQLPAEQRPTIGDWVIVDQHRCRIERLLDRKSLFKRVASGGKASVQLIAANIDTLFIVSSCNSDFNESRLERYLALAAEAGVDPVIVLTKADTTDDPDSYLDRAAAINKSLPVELVNALDASSLEGVKAWISHGSTVALVGSSGVGKSTLLNGLAGRELADTGAIREDDGKGRHTTTYRSLHLMADGGVLLDVPGMRELKVANLDQSLSEVFDDIDGLATLCKFGDCGHGDEPGCAVRLAIEDGRLSPRRLRNFQKLLREDLRNTSTLAEQRHQDRQMAKHIRQHTQRKNR